MFPPTQDKKAALGVVPLNERLHPVAMKRLNELLTQALEYLLYDDSGFELSLIGQIKRGWYWELN